jgi:hypothetical protein
VNPDTIVLPGDLAENGPLIQGSWLTLAVVEPGAATNTQPSAVWHVPIGP